MGRTKNPAWLGLDSRNAYAMHRLTEGLVLPGDRIKICAQTQVDFTGERLFVKKDCAPNFLIHSVWVGCNGSLARTEHQLALIAEPFAVDFDKLLQPDFAPAMFDGKKAVQIVIERSAAELLGAPFPLPMLNPRIDLCFEVENIGRYEQRFLGAFLGTALWSE